MDNLYSYLFIKYATMYKISPILLSAVCWVESSHTNVINYNDFGSPSIGICQIKNNTAKQMGFKNARLINPSVNVQVAAKYLRYQLDRYKSINHAVAAYNSGSVKYKGNEFVNKKYVRKVLMRYALNKVNE